MDRDASSEIAELAAELARHLRWAREKGEAEVPLPSAAALTPAAESIAPVNQKSAVPAGPVVPPVARLPHASAARPEAVPAARGSNAPAISREPAAVTRAPTLRQVREELGDCRRCGLCEGRRNIVFGNGDEEAELVFVGEGPGGEEDQQGLPFVGAAGQLLDRMIEAMGYRRSEVYVCNVVKCRPPGNRNPLPEEVAACEPFLVEQIRAIRPKAIVALGKFAAQTLLRTDAPITRLRGSWHEYEGIPLMPTFHPAYLLRAPAEKRRAWEDLQQVMARLGKKRP